MASASVVKAGEHGCNNSNGSEYVHTENSSSQRKNLALTGLFVGPIAKMSLREGNLELCTTGCRIRATSGYQRPPAHTKMTKRRFAPGPRAGGLGRAPESKPKRCEAVEIPDHVWWGG